MDAEQRAMVNTLLVLALMAGAQAGTKGKVGPNVPAFWVRPGYEVTLAAELPGARFLEVGDDGTLYISRPNPGEITAFKKPNKDGLYQTKTVYLTDQAMLHGLCVEGGWLWYSTSGSIHKTRDTNGDGVCDEDIAVIPEGQLPKGGGHWWRSIVVTGDAIFTSIGDMSNASDPGETERQKVFKFNKDGSGKTLWSGGIRNTEKLRLRPGTSEVWGVDHGSDNMGAPFGEAKGNLPITNNNPPDEFNHYEQGKFYGHPFIPGYGFPRLEFKDRPDILELAAKTTLPAWNFPAHAASNAFCFVSRKNQFPADHVGDAFVASHGSSNSTIKVGYSIDRVCFDKETGKPYGMLPIVKLLDGDKALGRPVDCVEAPDGSILFSDDAGGKVYRIRYVGKK